MGDGRAEGSSGIGDGGQAAISLTSDVDGTDSGSLLDSILPVLLKKQSSDGWLVALFYSSQMTQQCWTTFWMAAAAFVYRSKSRSCTLKTNNASSNKIPLPFPASGTSSVLQLFLPLVPLCPFSGPPIPSGLHQFASHVAHSKKFNAVVLLQIQLQLLTEGH